MIDISHTGLCSRDLASGEFYNTNPAGQCRAGRRADERVMDRHVRGRSIPKNSNFIDGDQKVKANDLGPCDARLCYFRFDPALASERSGCIRQRVPRVSAVAGGVSVMELCRL